MKKTVNQDIPTMYHLFYGDLTGSAGTELSFFEIPVAGRTRSRNECYHTNWFTGTSREDSLDVLENTI